MTITPEQNTILEFMSPAAGEGLTLAHDIAASLGIAPRAMGAKLRALEGRGLVRRAIVKERASMRTDRLYGWELTDAGLDQIVPF